MNDDDRRDTARREGSAASEEADLLREAEALEDFRRSADNLYERVRALLFLFAGIAWAVRRRFPVPVEI